MNYGIIAPRSSIPDDRSHSICLREESPDSMWPRQCEVDACESREGVIFRRKGQQKVYRPANLWNDRFSQN